MQVIDIQQKLDSFDDHWSPRVIAALNGQHVKVVKLLGEFDWHFHKDEDELFMVVEGELTLHFRDRTIELTPGQSIKNYKKITNQISKKDIKEWADEESTIDKYKERYKRSWKSELKKSVARMLDEI